MTEESGGQEERRTSHLKGNAAGCLFDSPALLLLSQTPAACGGTNCVHR